MSRVSAVKNIKKNLSLFYLMVLGILICEFKANNVNHTNLKVGKVAYVKQTQRTDAFDGINRFISHFNDIIFYAFINPLTKSYDKVCPSTLKNIVTNFLSNLSTPFYAVCGFFALDHREGFRAMKSFFVNTLCGVGLFKVDKFTPKYYSMDNVLRRYDVPQGEYLMLPILGPSSFRDVVGRCLSYFVNPFYIFTKNTQSRDKIWIYYSCAELIDTNKEIYNFFDSLKNSGNDYYNVLKSVYLQKTRNKEKQKNVVDYSDEF